MNEQTNSAEALIHLRAAVHKLEQTMQSGVNAQSVNLALDVARRASELLCTVVDERAVNVGQELIAKKLRAAA
jgi:type VI protein secretion system component VasF